VLAGVTARHTLDIQHKFVFELGWRGCFRHVWQHRGDGILQSLREGLLPDAADALELPADIREACTGMPAVDEAVHALYATGMLQDHARMWLASHVVHMRKVHWRFGADWFYGHRRDDDLTRNHLSWKRMAASSATSSMPTTWPVTPRAVAQPRARDRHVLRGTRPHGTPVASPGLPRRCGGA
jgi:deoxyribodipyrimidine photo-lyase